jgi:hypothetical protein
MSTSELARSDIADVRSDFGHLAARFDGLEARFDRMDDHFYGPRETLRDQFRNYTFVTVGVLTALTGIFAALVSIVR